jgi:hypothetical protein
MRKIVGKSQHLCAILDNADKDIQEIFDDLAIDTRKYSSLLNNKRISSQYLPSMQLS